ncbi:MAG TPA: hypothetical protein VF423_12830 [Actinomycetes bacterium]|jgi:hypothetical protein
MTTVVASPTLEERLDQLSAHVAEIAGDLRQQRESREQWHELAQTLAPVSLSAFDLVSSELEDLSDDVTIDDVVRLARTLARSLPQLERVLDQLQGLNELGSEVTSLGSAGFAKAAGALAEVERKGYFAVARGGRSVLDRVVAASADEDFETLGDNLVMLLGVAKIIATPAMAGLLDRTMVSLREGQSAHSDPPSMYALLKQLRQPQTRRGVARSLDLLQALGAEPTTTSDQHKRKE